VIITITPVITTAREQVAGLVASTGLATYSYLPDDVAHLPCHVIGRPSLRETFTSGVMGVELDVTLMGRRINDEDSQRELDALADQLFAVLGGTKNVRVGDAFYRCTLFLPGTVLVAGQEYPAYIATVTTDTVTC
jgi:hypothetical protein